MLGERGEPQRRGQPQRVLGVHRARRAVGAQRLQGVAERGHPERRARLRPRGRGGGPVLRHLAGPPGGAELAQQRAPVADRRRPPRPTVPAEPAAAHAPSSRSRLRSSALQPAGISAGARPAARPSATASSTSRAPLAERLHRRRPVRDPVHREVVAIGGQRAERRANALRLVQQRLEGDQLAAPGERLRVGQRRADRGQLGGGGRGELGFRAGGRRTPPAPGTRRPAPGARS